MTARPLDRCFRYRGAPHTDPAIHATLVEVQIWRMLEAARQAEPGLDRIGALTQWTLAQQERLALEEEADERDYRLRVLKIAVDGVRARLGRQV